MGEAAAGSFEIHESPQTTHAMKTERPKRLVPASLIAAFTS